MILDEVGMLIVSSPRSQAYLQFLIKNCLYPSYVIVMDEENSFLSPGQLSNDKPGRSGMRKKSFSADPSHQYFNIDEPILETLNNANIPYEICPTKDANNSLVVNRLAKRKEKYFIYSGIGGVILRKEILGIGKRFLHVHPGIIPEYKGSTTIYYSILNEDQCGVSAIFLDEHIDSGPVIKMKVFDKPIDGKMIDYFYDPYIRAKLLLEVIRDYSINGEFRLQKKNMQRKRDETYFIVHPVLKHIGILTCVGDGLDG